CGLEHLLLLFWIEREKLCFSFDRMRSSSSPVCAPPKNKPTLRLPCKGHDALVRNDVPVVLDGLVLARIPNRHRAGHLAVWRFTADVDHAIRTVNHGPGPEVPLPKSTKRDRVAIRRRPEIPAGHSGIVKS